VEIPFIGGAYEGRSKNLNAQICQNLYPVIDREGGKTVIALMNTPGLTSWLPLGGEGGEIRGLHVMDDYLYAVYGNSLYKINTTPTATLLDTIGTSAGKVWMVDDGTNLMIVDGASGYVWDGATLTEIADADFPVPSSLTYQDTHFIISKAGTGEFYISAVLDPTDWDALDYATAESNSDKLVAIRSVGSALWLLGERSTEIWYSSGETFPFNRNPGGILDVGCGAVASPADIDGTMLWLDKLRRVVMTEGYSYRTVSTHQIEYQFSQYSNVSDAIGFCYNQEGHNFYVLTFPLEAKTGKTWVYDLTTSLWHTRASGANDLRHRANCFVMFDEKRLVGDYDNGTIYEYDLGAYDDDGTTLRAIRAAQSTHANRKLMRFNSFEIEFEAGVGLAVGQGSDPQAMLEWSVDGGHTWSNEHWTDIGKIGKYKTRAIWRRLGMGRDFIPKVTISDPVKRVMISAHLDAEAVNA